MNTAKFHRHVTLTDTHSWHTAAQMDEECTDISMTLRNMPIGQDGQGNVILGDECHFVRLSASDMDKLAREWLRYRIGDTGNTTGGEA